MLLARRRLRSFLLLCGLAAGIAAPAHAAERTYSFGVVTHRSAVLTAELWNPILEHVARRTGIRLQLKVTRTVSESSLLTIRGEFDFLSSALIFKPEALPQGYRVILRPRSETFSAQIVSLDSGPIEKLADLQGRPVGFPSRAGFIAYAVPMDHLLRQGIAVAPVFAGNQEGVMGQLKAGKIEGASVSSQVLSGFLAREPMRVRVLWSSKPYADIPVAAHPRVPEEVVAAVQKALASMHEAPEGARVLEEGGRRLGLKPPYGFAAAKPEDYEAHRSFYRTTVVKDLE